MKNFYLLILIVLLSWIKLSAQDMKMPPAIDNAFLKACEGEWVSDEYELMGMKWHDEAIANWILNNQYLEMKIKTFGQEGFLFNSYAIMTADKGGYFKQWTFDNWGSMYAGFFEGKIEGMKLTVKGGTLNTEAEGTIVIEGNVMTQEFTFTEQNAEGKIVNTTVKMIFRKK